VTVSPAVSSLAVLIVVLALMLVELRVSHANERKLRSAGAIDAPDPVYGTMRWVYPGAFVAMALEGALWGGPSPIAFWGGLAIFVLGKLLKTWAIVSLGRRWTYRVLVLPGAPLVTRGPYAFMKHPNYIGVIGELAGMAGMTGARVTGWSSALFFALLLQRRIVAEERALGIRDAGAP
jgi:methyltransferase